METEAVEMEDEEQLRLLSFLYRKRRSLSQGTVVTDQKGCQTGSGISRCRKKLHLLLYFKKG